MNLLGLFPAGGVSKAPRRMMFMLAVTAMLPSHAATPLADQPVFSSTGVPGNLALPLSVEYPTAVSVAHPDSTYSTSTATPYLGYFDPNKCYKYVAKPTDTTRSYFKPVGEASNRTCAGQWSGNFLNWATMQTIDPFRWALTGGHRVVDLEDLTILEKANASGQGGTNNFPDRSLSDSALVKGASPWGTNGLRMRIQGLGTKMRFSASGDPNNAAVPWNGEDITGDNKEKVYEVDVRVKVCDTSVGVEDNCKRYPSGYWKPEGLIQKYSDRIRLSAFGYLNDSRQSRNGVVIRDGGVLRARQKFVGPEIVVPGQPNQPNAFSEWDARTGVFTVNPDSSDAADTAADVSKGGFGVPVANSGVINYLNKFGVSGSYKMYDPVGELYYAALRYFKHLGNVPSYSSPGKADESTRNQWVDGFPVITNWDDPIQYTCQRNFILGIGDVNTHADKNVPGSTGTASEPTKPDEVTNDETVDSVKATNKVGELEGLGGSLATAVPYNGCCTNNSALMAGLAYDANTSDIRPDLPNPKSMPRGQSVKTYWLDVLEYQEYKPNNQFYLAAKYGGFRVPDGYNAYDGSRKEWTENESWWRNNTDTVGGQPRPDNYFTAARPDQVVSGLTRAFADIASQLKAFTTSFATPLPQVSEAGNASYSAKFSGEHWTGDVAASTMGFDEKTGKPALIAKWSLTDKLNSQLAGAGWSSDTSITNGRRVVTWNTETQGAVPFRHASISASQRAALDSPYRDGDDSSDLLNYLRGDRSNERLPDTSGRPYRYRPELLGDIVGSKITAEGPPSLVLSDAANPGYSKFKEAWKDRPTVVYFGGNDGMLHAVNGSMADNDAAAGREIFAYVPGDLYQGPNNTPGVDGLAGLGNPQFSHHYYVDATPTIYDIDFDKTPGANRNTGKPDWRSVLIGGLGKGGRSYYAIDVTDPASMTSESAVANRVLWEFTDEDMGYTFGDPSVVKTRKYGWVVILPSGYNNRTGMGYLFIVDPATGQLLEKVSTGEGSTTQDAGLAHANTYVLDRTDGTADALYAGDLRGNLWRWNLTAEKGAYPAPEKLAQLTDKDKEGSPQPITTRPMIEVSPSKLTRHVLVGTGRLLHTSDIKSSQVQAFYSVMDGNETTFNKASDLPKGVSFPLQRSNLVRVEDLIKGMTDVAASSMGWYVELGTQVVESEGGAKNTIGWRVIGSAKNFYGLVAFASVLPNGSACEPNGSSHIYGIDFATGTTVLEAGAYESVSGIVTDLRFYSVDGKPRLVAGSDLGEVSVVPFKWRPELGMRRLNWRELPVVD